MTTIKYKQGDATDPEQDADIRVITHVCNNLGKWGRGFVLAVSARDKIPEQMYRRWSGGIRAAADGMPFELGEVQFVAYRTNEGKEGLFVANMVGQHDIKSHNGVPPVRYDAIRKCLQKVAHWLSGHRDAGKTVAMHACRFGAGLAGGSWERIEAIIVEEVCSKGIPVTVYDLP